MKEKSPEKFVALLDSTYEWPTKYMFKLIVPSTQIEILREMFEKDQIAEKLSGKGNYISVTVEKVMNSSEEVLSIYQQVSTIDGIISL